ncbi:MAG: serine/threonine-protein kinase [Acidobacteriota bacterium]
MEKGPDRGAPRGPSEPGSGSESAGSEITGAETAEAGTTESLDVAGALGAGPGRPGRRGPAQLRRGDHVGRLVVVDLLGRGGMGEVYGAYDPDLDRRVAVKLLQPRGERDGAGRQRLMREAQALARLNHPNVITAYDVGTRGDRVYLSMEYVEGETLHAWLRRSERTPKDIVATFVRAGRGLAAAHGAGLVHRDFKPGNVMVAKDGRVLVLDFGLARARDGAEAPVGEGAVVDVAEWSPTQASGVFEHPLTVAGSAPGTPAYMAPEQRRGDVASAASDQFSFCVALFHALFGHWPYAPEGEGAEDGGPKSPTFQIPSGSRVPMRWRRALRRGLDLDPELRFPDMESLLRELSPGRARARGWAAAAALVAAAAAAVTWGYRQDRPCTGAAEHLVGVWDPSVEARIGARFASFPQTFAAEAWNRVRAALQQRSAEWVDMHGRTCRATRVTGEQSERQLDLRMECLSSRLEEMRTLADLFADADRDLVTRAVAAVDGLVPASACADPLAFGSLSAMPEDAGARREIRAIRSDLAQARAHLVAFDAVRAGELAEPTVATSEALAYWPLVAESLLTRGVVRAESRRAEDARIDLEAAVAAAAAGGHDRVVAEALVRLVRVTGYRLRDRPAGLRYAAQAHDVLGRLGDDPRARAELADAEGTLHFHGNRYELALDRHRRALELRGGARRESSSPPSPTVAATLLRLGNVHLAMGHLDLARDRFSEALEAYEEALGPHHPQVAFALDKVGSVHLRAADYTEALDAHRRALDVASAALGPDDRQTAMARLNTGMALQYLGRFDGALEHLNRAVADLESALGDDHWEVSFALGGLALTLGAAGRPEEALDVYARALVIQEKGYGADHPWVASTRHNLAETHRRTGRCAQALPLYRRSRAALEAASGDQASRIADTLTGEGRCLVELQEPGRAVALLERALELRAGADAASTRLAETRFALAGALTAVSPSAVATDRALDLARLAAEAYRAATDRYRPQLADVEAWLASTGER